MRRKSALRVRRVLVLTAALPILQLSACQAALFQPLGNLSNSVPSILFNSFFNAALQTVFQLLGASVGGTGTTGTGI